MYDILIDKALLDADDKFKGKIPTETTTIELNRGQIRMLLKAMSLAEAVRALIR